MKKISAVLAAAFIVCLGSVTASAQKQVTYQINTEHTGATKFPGGFNVPLRLVWSRTLAAEVAYPVIAGGRVFFTQRRWGNAAVMALDLATGRNLWTASIRTDFTWSAATYDNGKLFVFNLDGRLSAFNAATGERLWSSVIVTEPFFTGTAAPTAKHGMVYVTTEGPLFEGRGAGLLNAVDQRDGRVVWRAPTPLGSLDSPPTVSDDGVFLSAACQAYKFDAHTGEPRWRFNGICYGGEGHASILYSGRLYARAVRTIVAPRVAFSFDEKTGKRIDKFDDIVDAPAFYDGIGYFPGRDGLVARSVDTNDVIWTFAHAHPLARPPLVINGKVVVVSDPGTLWDPGTLFVLNGKTGAELQRISLGTPFPWLGDMEGPAGLGAGEGMLILSNGRRVSAYKGAP